MTVSLRGTAVLAGFGADLVFGDPREHHPVAAFGWLAARAESAAYVPTRTRGAMLTLALLSGVAVGVSCVARRGPRTRASVMAVVLWSTLAGRTLRGEAERIADLLEHGDIPAARSELRSLCGRDAAELDAEQIVAGIIESIAENTSDAIVGALFWAAVAGPAGAAGFRAANTLDAMWGHRSDRYREFGFAAAKLDDWLNFIPARLTAALTCIAAPLVSGSPQDAAGTVRRDAHDHPSPNAGVAEAAFAGALGLELGGPLSYGGRHEERPRLGNGRRPQLSDVRRANRLSFAVCAGAALLCAVAEAAR